MLTYRIHFIRHGHTQANEDGRFIGVTDIPLSESGRKDLKRLRNKYEYPYVEKVYSSPLSRCIETAGIIYPEIELQTVGELREFNFGIYENMLLSEIDDPDFLIGWAVKGINNPKGGDTKEEFMEMISKGLDLVIKSMMSENIRESAIITHGGVISTLLARFGVPQRTPAEWLIESGMGYTVLTSSQMWARDGIFEINALIPFLKE